MKKYNINLTLEVDPDANFLELDNGDNEDIIEELIRVLLYDLDDVKCSEIECEVL